MNEPPNMNEPGESRLSRAGIIALVAMAALLIAAIVWAVQVWQSMPGTAMSAWGWTFLALGVLVTTGLGAGLMALVFYSSRNNRDF